MEIAENTIYYYLREKYWNQCRKYCAEVTYIPYWSNLSQEYKAINDPAFLFWRAFASYMNGQVNDAINDLNSVSKKKEIQYAAIVALIFYHKQCQTVDYVRGI